MITRRKLLTGLAGGVAATAGAAALVIKDNTWSGWLKRPHAHTPQPITHADDSAPRYSFTKAETNTGIYAPTPSNLSFVTAGEEVMRIVPGGKGAQPIMYVKQGVKVRDIVEIIKGKPA